jgi:large conductance mechanosensitive channel
MSLAKEFKEFAMRGNVVDLAVGIIIGGAFGKIVSSAVADVIMPPIGLLLGGVKFTDLSIVLKEPVVDAAGAITTQAVSINYGNFIQTMVDFLIIAFAIFMMIKAMNSLKKKEEAPAEEPAPPAPTKEELLLTEIRDLLKNK